MPIFHFPVKLAIRFHVAVNFWIFFFLLKYAKDLKKKGKYFSLLDSELK